MPELSEVLFCAQNAKNHARKKVLKGTTHEDGVANSSGSSDIDQRSALLEAVIAMREVISEQAHHPNPLEANVPDLAWLEINIEISSKFTLGNCYEFTLHALDYILNRAPHIDAEVFKIMRGDHYFLVLNRDENSDKRDPKTWGKNAVICDPWLNAVYAAGEYLTYLGKYYDPAKGHQFTIAEGNLNIAHLWELRKVENLKNNYLKEVQGLLEIVEDYKKALIKEKNLLDKSKIPVLSIKVAKLDKLITKLKNINCDEYTDESKSYRVARSELLVALDLLKQEVQYNFQFTVSEAQTLGLFGGSASKKSHLQEIVEHADARLNESTH
ncbi:Uncharacterised protein [Legionella wadsworthii]|uniref:Uncharacterized protein n=1 Tax=Legionella wadsworthii TaxID=28088 RepID=A0A378LP98_9GAMM|nr:hypothetical protein [Legionella wadsworthii]STY28756.1 Uncharacterised protein [Legionella wadsworthii]